MLILGLQKKRYICIYIIDIPHPANNNNNWYTILYYGSLMFFFYKWVLINFTLHREDLDVLCTVINFFQIVWNFQNSLEPPKNFRVPIDKLSSHLWSMWTIVSNMSSTCLTMVLYSLMSSHLFLDLTLLDFTRATCDFHSGYSTHWLSTWSTL